jgi:hypothetical protein
MKTSTKLSHPSVILPNPDDATETYTLDLIEFTEFLAPMDTYREILDSIQLGCWTRTLTVADVQDTVLRVVELALKYPDMSICYVTSQLPHYTSHAGMSTVCTVKYFDGEYFVDVNRTHCVPKSAQGGYISKNGWTSPNRFSKLRFRQLAQPDHSTYFLTTD